MAGMAAARGRRASAKGPGQRGNRKGARGRRAEERVRREYERRGWSLRRGGAGSDWVATRPGRDDPLHLEVKTGSGRLNAAQEATRRRVGRTNYRVEWRGTRRSDGPWVGRKRKARATRREGGRIVRQSRGSITWQ